MTAIELTPSSGFRVSCRLLVGDGGVFREGVYRVIADAVGWRRHTRSPTHQWEVQVRRPGTPEEQLKFHTTEGGIALVDGELQQAVSHYEKAIALDRSSPGVLDSLALAYDDLHRFPEALRLSQEAYLLAKARPEPELGVHGYFARRYAGALVLAGNEEAAREVLREVGTPEATIEKFVAGVRQRLRR